MEEGSGAGEALLEAEAASFCRVRWTTAMMLSQAGLALGSYQVILALARIRSHAQRPLHRTHFSEPSVSFCNRQWCEMRAK